MEESGIEVRTKTKLESFGIRNIRVFGIRNPQAWNPGSSHWNPDPLHAAIY